MLQSPHKSGFFMKYGGYLQEILSFSDILLNKHCDLFSKKCLKGLEALHFFWKKFFYYTNIYHKIFEELFICKILE